MEAIVRPLRPEAAAAQLTFVPDKPARMGPRPFGEIGPAASVAPEGEVAGARGASDADFSFSSTNFDDNSTYNSGILYIPPDCSMAAGVNHVVTVVNAVVRMHTKSNGATAFVDDLQAFFGAVSPINDTFDPKVLYDAYADRFVMVTLELAGTVQAGAANKSRILLGVSATSNPTGAWYFTAINSKELLPDAFEYWADYPGFAVDEEAIYVTVNLFAHFDNLGGGSRVYIIDKGEVGGFYSGAAASFTRSNPFLDPSAPYAMTHQPAMVHPDPPGGSVGTFFVGYNGLTDGTNEAVQVLLVEDPLGTPTFSFDFVSIGNVEDVFSSLPQAAQSGSAELLATNDRRTLSAVYNDKKLWTTTTIRQRATHAEASQVSSHWIRLDVSSPSSPAFEESGFLGGEDISTGSFTFFPAIEVNPLGHAVVGFSASDNSIFPGSYFATRGNSGGGFGASMELASGTDFYVRKFSGSLNRWGDYSGASVDPQDGCVWIFNEHAMTRGTITNTTQDGRWATTVGKVCPNGWIFGDDFSDGFDRWSTTIGVP